MYAGRHRPGVTAPLRSACDIAAGRVITSASWSYSSCANPGNKTVDARRANHRLVQNGQSVVCSIEDAPAMDPSA